MALNFCRLYYTFFDKPKTKLLIRKLGGEGIVALQKIWIMTAQDYPDGVITLTAEQIEIMAELESVDLVMVLCGLEFLEKIDDKSYEVHDWSVNNPHLTPEAKKRREERARKGGKAKNDPNNITKHNITKHNITKQASSKQKLSMLEAGNTVQERNTESLSVKGKKIIFKNLSFPMQVQGNEETHHFEKLEHFEEWYPWKNPSKESKILSYMENHLRRCIHCKTQFIYLEKEQTECLSCIEKYDNKFKIQDILTIKGV